MNDILNMEGLEPLASGTAETDQAITIAVARRGRSRDWCPHCGAHALAPNGTRRVSIADMPIRGKPVTLEWDRQRFKCREDRCGKTCSDHHQGLHDAFEMTRRLYDWIGNRCMNMTFTSVANDTGMDERTVRRVTLRLRRPSFNRCARHHRPAVLVDEVPNPVALQEIDLPPTLWRAREFGDLGAR